MRLGEKKAVSCKGTYRQHANQLDSIAPEMHWNDCAVLNDNLSPLANVFTTCVIIHESPHNEKILAW